jgi:hypothetical protein
MLLYTARSSLLKALYLLSAADTAVRAASNAAVISPDHARQDWGRKPPLRASVSGRTMRAAAGTNRR